MTGADPYARLVNVAEAAKLTGREPATIRDWVRKDKLEPYGPPGPNGQNYFLEADVLNVEREMRHNNTRNNTRKKT